MIVKFNQFIKENQTVILDNGQGGNAFQTQKGGSKKSIAYLNAVIKSFIEKVYGEFGFKYPNDPNFIHFDMNINGRIINTEYVAKMVNNYTIFRKVIRVFNLRDEDSFYHFMKNNLNNIYHYNGEFFRRESLPILINTTRKGNEAERKSKEIFNNYAINNKIQIIIQDPTLEEDIKGVDFKFLHNGKSFTVQVKPYKDYEITSDSDLPVGFSDISKKRITDISQLIKVKSPGSLSLDTNYLVLYNNSNYIILKNPSNNRIKIVGDEFITDKSNILQII